MDPPSSSSSAFMHTAPSGPRGPTPPTTGGDAEEMQHMWQFLDSSLSPSYQHQQQHPQQHQHQPHPHPQPPPPHQHQHPHPHQLPPHQQHPQHPHPQQAPMPMAPMPMAPMPADAASPPPPPLTDEDNGMYNELGDVFNMFFNLDTDDHGGSPQAPHLGGGNGGPSPGHAHPSQAQQPPRFMPTGLTPPPATLAAMTTTPDATGRVQLPRNVSAGSSFGEGLSPGNLLGYPSMSPATMHWLQSLSKSPSSESLTGLVSPATMSFSGSAGGLSVLDGGSTSGSAQGGLPRSPSCEMIDWKAYNDAVGMAEKTQKEAKWRVIPQHGPHADPAAAAAATAATSEAIGNGYGGNNAATRPPTGGDGGLRNHFTRGFQTVKSTVVSLVGAALSTTDGTTTATHTQHPEQQQQHQHQQPQPQQQHQSHLAPPQGPHAPPSSTLMPQVVLPMEAQQQQFELARMTDDKNSKRKAIISPEYVQYGSSSTTSNPTTSGEPSMVSTNAPPAPGVYSSLLEPIKLEPVAQGTYATQVPDPTGRRPSKKTLHQAGASPTIPTTMASPVTSHAMATTTGPPSSNGSMMGDGLGDTRDEALAPGAPVRCKCTGKCRNARCACVKAGFVCGVHCKCVSCANPFVPMEKAGIDIQTMVQDVCLMQFLSKIKDMQELLDSTVTYECCGNGNGSVQVKDTVEKGFTCPSCQARFTYSWCNNRLCHDQKKPRKHCAKCRRCGDHRNEHCDDCNHCYFAGVANSFSCSCKGGKHSTGGAKSRSAIPSSLVASSDDGSNAGSPALKLPVDGRMPGDENANPQTTSGGNGYGPASAATASSSSAASASGTSVTAGLSNADAEKDDACPVQ